MSACSCQQVVAGKASGSRQTGQPWDRSAPEVSLLESRKRRVTAGSSSLVLNWFQSIVSASAAVSTSGVWALYLQPLQLTVNSTEGNHQGPKWKQEKDGDKGKKEQMDLCHRWYKRPGCGSQEMVRSPTLPLWGPVWTVISSGTGLCFPWWATSCKESAEKVQSEETVSLN